MRHGSPALLEEATARLVQAVLESPGCVLVAFAALTAVAGFGLTRLELNTDGAAIYPTGDPRVERTIADRVVFNESDVVIVLVTGAGRERIASRTGFRT